MFVSGSLVQTRVGNFTHPPPNVVHILVMFDPCLDDDDIIDDANARASRGLSKSYNSLLMSVEAIRCFPLHCWSRRFWYIGTVGWNLESFVFLSC